MECSHLSENIALDVFDASVVTKNLECSGCSVKDQLWLCLKCSSVNCGRYINGHAKQHAEEKEHNLCISCEQYSVYCYKCNDYISNDTPNNSIEKVRQELMKLRTSYSDDSPRSDAGVLPDTTVGDDGVLPDVVGEYPPSKGLENREFPRKKHSASVEETLRSLRPRSRKRSYSDESLSPDNESPPPQPQPAKRLSTSSSNGRVSRDKRVVGLKNLGNTCFMNAVLQSLNNIQEFSCYFNKLPSLEVKEKNGRKVYHSRSYTRQDVQEVVMAEELRKVLINLNTGSASKGAISPECLFLVIWKVVPRFRGYQQQDAHEFLRYMLDRLHTELLQLVPTEVQTKDGAITSQSKSKNSIVTDVFGGTLQSEVRCLVCGTESKKHDPFLDLSLDIPDKFVAKRSGGLATCDVPEHCTLGDCLNSFVDVEELEDTERYFCAGCKCKQKSTKRFWIRRLPNVLSLHIKRFRWNNFYRMKIDTDISFPLEALDLSRFVLGGLPETRSSRAQLYDLAAVIVHHGSGAGSGHYTAFAINDGQWYHFNDQTVRPIDPDSVATCKPYILFYIRREPHSPNS